MHGAHRRKAIGLQAVNYQNIAANEAIMTRKIYKLEADIHDLKAFKSNSQVQVAKLERDLQASRDESRNILQALERKMEDRDARLPAGKC